MRHFTVSLALLALFILAACEFIGPVTTAGPTSWILATPTGAALQSQTLTPAPPLARATLPTPAPAAITTLPSLAAPRPSTESMRPLPVPAVSLAVEPSDARSVFALLVTDSLYHSRNGGQTWQPVPLPVPELPYTPATNPDRKNDILIMPQQAVRITRTSPVRLFVNAGDTLLRSDDVGVTWHILESDVRAWALAESDEQTLYVWRDSPVAASSGLYWSNNSGQDWQRVFAGYFPPGWDYCCHQGMSALLVAPATPAVLYAGTDYGVYRSRDGGKTWALFNAGMPDTQRAYRWVPILAAVDNAVYAVSEVSRDGVSHDTVLLRSRLSDAQPGWEVIGSKIMAVLSLDFQGVHTLVSDPIQAGSLYLGTEAGLFRSSDTGTEWTPVEVPNVRAVYRVAVAPGKPITLYMWTDRGFVRTP